MLNQVYLGFEANLIVIFCFYQIGLLNVKDNANFDQENYF